MKLFSIYENLSILLALFLCFHFLYNCNGEIESLNPNKLHSLPVTEPYTSDKLKFDKNVNGPKIAENHDNWLSLSSIEKFSEALGFRNMSSFEDIVEEIDKNKYGILLSLNKYIEWATLEEQIAKMFRKRLALLTDEIYLIKSYLSDYEDSSRQAILNARGSTDTPEQRGRIVGKSSVLGHRMTHRYVTELSQLRNLYTSTEYKENRDEITKGLFPEKKRKRVNSEDMYLSMTAFTHLGEVLMRHPKELQKGLRIDTQAGGELNFIHCAEIGIFALYRERYVMSVEWLELANSLSHSDLTKLLVRFAAQAHNKAGELMYYYPSYRLFTNLYDSTVTAHQSPENRTSVQKREFQRNRGFSADSDIYKAIAQYSELCMGETLRPLHLAKDLICYFENKIHPYFYINPMKTEELSENPPILQFYEIIGNKTNSEIQRRFESLIRLNDVTGGTGPDYVTTWRTSAGVGVIPELMPDELFWLASSLTGLRILNNSDLTHYVEYTYGKCYTQHGDYYQNSESAQHVLKEKGDRLATLLYFLELSDLGGQTPFSQGGISANPVRNSAIFWYNLHRNGTARRDVIHGACPVVHGNKIIMNHWIYYQGNFDTHKCTLNQYE